MNIDIEVKSWIYVVAHISYLKQESLWITYIIIICTIISFIYLKCFDNFLPYFLQHHSVKYYWCTFVLETITLDWHTKFYHLEIVKFFWNQS